MFTHSLRTRHCLVSSLVLAFALSGCNSDDDPTTDKPEKLPAACTFSKDSLLPLPTGKYCIGTTEYQWVSTKTDPLAKDPTRKREVAARVYYPAATNTQGKPFPYYDRATAQSEAKVLAGIPGVGSFLEELRTHAVLDATSAPLPQDEKSGADSVVTAQGYPVLVYSPGWGGQHQQMTALLEELASHGYVVVALNHPYVSGFVTLSDGSTATVRPEAEMTDALLGEHYRAVLSDIGFVLDQLSVIKKDAKSTFAKHLDLERIGLLGHSLGGGAAVSLLAKDPRVDAGIDIDGSISFGTGAPPPTNKPLLLLLAGDHTLSTDPEVAELWRQHEGEAYRVEIQEANHVSFIDYGWLAQELLSEPAPPEIFGAIEPKRMIALEREAVRQFFAKAFTTEEIPELNSLSEPGKVTVTARSEDPWLSPASNTAKYLEMRDGVRIAVDLWLPADASESKRYPTVIRATRYFRDVGTTDPTLRDQTPAAQEAKFWVSQGYAVMLVDARGSGASFGTRAHPWSPDEVRDYGEVVDYIVRQPWSNGSIGALGVSYEGNTAALIGLQGKSAVKAVIPQYADMDVFADVAAPGGIPNEGFVSAWMKSNQALDRNDICAAYGLVGEDCVEVKRSLTGVKPVDDDPELVKLSAALAEHAKSPDQLDVFRKLDARDDDFNGKTLDQLSPARRADLPGWGDTNVMFFGSWSDAGTARGALDRFRATTSPMTVVIGAFSHGGEYDTDPFHPADAPPALSQQEQTDLMTGYFGEHLGGMSLGLPRRVIHYYTLGQDGFRTTDTWPPSGVKDVAYYLRSGSRLSPETPLETESADTYPVDYSTTSGMTNRWWTQMGGPDVVYPDRAQEDGKLLVYESEPLEEDLLVTGTPELSIQLASSHGDGAIFVYLEDVAPDGRVTYVTEGQLRLWYRAVSPDAPAGHMGPYHTFQKKDGSPMLPSVSEPIRIGLEPTSALFAAKHRIRIALAGHDASCFKRIPAEGNPVWTVSHNATQRSSIVLPVMPQR